ncbi:MAG: DegT/DnrJ/EryC1/StrS family aminotransferase [Ignavibacteriales bacterium]|nr:DegT/DnrJ/EryC1/StrS family aminotransferase [Ignavibacteriales bacterium]
MPINDSKLAINGGTPVTKQPIIIHKPYLAEDDFIAIDTTARSTFISGNGPQCMEFEKQFAEYLGMKHVLFTNSCTTALDLAFKAKNFPAGSEVIVPNFTYTSTALGPLLNNLKIRLCDVYGDNGNIDSAKVLNLINEKTVAIMPVDYAGNPADSDAINSIARKYNLFVVQDAAQSIGSMYKDKKTGSLSDVTCFSFHGTKNLTTGEGGALVTNDDQLAELAKFIREKGTNKQSFLIDNKSRGFYEYETIGSSFVQSNILGALAGSQLKKIDWITAERKAIAEYYYENLKDLPNIKFNRITEAALTNWHIFGILVPPEHRYWIMDAGELKVYWQTYIIHHCTETNFIKD